MEQEGKSSPLSFSLRTYYTEAHCFWILKSNLAIVLITLGTVGDLWITILRTTYLVSIWYFYELVVWEVVGNFIYKGTSFVTSINPEKEPQTYRLEGNQKNMWLCECLLKKISECILSWATSPSALFRTSFLYKRQATNVSAIATGGLPSTASPALSFSQLLFCSPSYWQLVIHVPFLPSLPLVPLFSNLKITMVFLWFATFLKVMEH